MQLCRIRLMRLRIEGNGRQFSDAVSLDFMPSPKSGTAGTAVEPADPADAQEADKADPGEVEKIKAEQRQTNQGKYASEKTKPLKPPENKEEAEKRKSWIEIELLDDKKKPMAGEPYKVIMPDGKTAAEGTLDEKGHARVEGIEPGSCKVIFPRREKSCWKKK
jgi:hypothetical protein